MRTIEAARARSARGLHRRSARGRPHKSTERGLKAAVTMGCGSGREGHQPAQEVPQGNSERPVMGRRAGLTGGGLTRGRSAAHASPVNTLDAYNGGAACSGRHNNCAERRKRAGFLGWPGANNVYYDKLGNAAPQHGRAGSPVAAPRPRAVRGRRRAGVGARRGRAALVDGQRFQDRRLAQVGQRQPSKQPRDDGFARPHIVCPRHFKCL